MSWGKSDGAAIKITFDKALLGDVSGNQSHFTVTAKEYDWVPNGPFKNVNKTILNTISGATTKEIILNMLGTSRFESAVELTIIYDGLGTLAGATGNVEAFTQTFVPQGLISKPDQNNQEHIEVSNISVTCMLIGLNYVNTAAQELGHVEITDINAAGVLTHINDL